MKKFEIVVNLDTMDCDKLVDIANSKGWTYYLSPIHPIDEKSNHVHKHLGVWLTSDRTLEDVSKIMGVSSNSIQYIKSQKFTYLKYICHIGYAGKTTLDPHLVVTNDIKYDADKLLADTSSLDFLDTLVEDVINGRVSIYEVKHDPVKSAIIINKGFTRKFNEAIKAYYDIKYAEVQNDMDISKTTVWLSGSQGSGKTVYAKTLAKLMGFTYYVTSSGKNPFDDYSGEDCVIIDELRSDVFKYDELLRFLDPHTYTFSASRFFNKAIFPKLIVITSVYTPNQFYSELGLPANADPVEQLLRRINYGWFQLDPVTLTMKLTAYDPRNGSVAGTTITEYPPEVVEVLKKASTEDFDALGGILDKFKLKSKSVPDSENPFA